MKFPPLILEKPEALILAVDTKVYMTKIRESICILTIKHWQGWIMLNVNHVDSVKINFLKKGIYLLLIS